MMNMMGGGEGGSGCVVGVMDVEMVEGSGGV